MTSINWPSLKLDLPITNNTIKSYSISSFNPSNYKLTTPTLNPSLPKMKSI